MLRINLLKVKKCGKKRFAKISRSRDWLFQTSTTVSKKDRIPKVLETINFTTPVFVTKTGSRLCVQIKVNLIIR